MRKYVITTDTTSDLPPEYVKEHNLTILPLQYMIDDVVYGEDKSLDMKEFYDMMRSGKMPSTMACVPEQAKQTFKKFLDEGYDVLHIAFSSALSSSYNNCVMIVDELLEEYPDASIKIIDSLSASMGEGLLVHKAIRMQEAGVTLEENCKWLEENKLNLCHLFTVDDLHHLHRGGRVSRATAIVGTIINVKPILHVDDEGRLIPLINVRGRKKSLATLVDHMAEAIKDYDGPNEDIFISHGDCVEDAEYVAKLIRERFGYENITISYVSQTVGAHSGPGTLALFFMGTKR